MSDKIEIDNNQYDLDELSDLAKSQVASLKYVDIKIREANNLKAILQRAKNSYIEDLKKEIISNKAGLFIDEN